MQYSWRKELLHRGWEEADFSPPNKHNAHVSCYTEELDNEPYTPAASL